MSTRALVIGIGNPFRGDDGAGPAVAQKLRVMNPRQARILEHSGEGAGLMDAWAGADAVIAVDAMRAGGAGGEIRRMETGAAAPELPLFFRSTHDFGLAEAVALARALGKLPPRLVIYGIEGGSFGHGAGLTPPVARAVEDAARRIAAELAAYF